VINNTAWKESYGKDNYQFENSTALDDFWPADIRDIFKTFSNEMHIRFGLALTQPTYTKATGWKFKFTKLGVPLIKNVIIGDDCFCIDDIRVADDSDMQKAIEYVNGLYNTEFIAAFDEKIKKRNQKQVERAKQRVQQEKDEMESFCKSIDASKLNKFKWAPKVPRRHLIRLYESDAKMMIDSELLDEVGFMMYARCIQAKTECELSKIGKLKCHNCGLILLKPQNGLMTCGCSYSYIFREYMRSFNKNRMPYGGANPFFFKFIEAWPKMKSDAEKMRLIDWVIHECHLNMLSGVKRSFAGINLFEGTIEQITQLINELAYGDIGNNLTPPLPTH